MGAHTKFSPSASDKWTNCPGYINLLKQVVDIFGKEESSEAAAEGTAAHEVAEQILKARNPTRALRGMDIDLELKLALEKYIDTVESILDRLYEDGLNPKLFVEEAMRLYDNLGGTADAVIVHDEGIVVIDYKHGQRVYVDPSSTQLKIYGYLAARKWGIEVGARQSGAGLSTIDLFVVQPRYIDKNIDKVRSVNYDLVGFMSDMLELIDGSIDRSEAGDNYVSGKHCLFCDAKPFCPEKKEVLVGALEAGKDLNAEKNLKFILDNAKEIQRLIKKAQALAIRGLESGAIDPEALGKGLKKRIGNRAWSHMNGEEGLAPLLRRHGVDRELVWARKLISPAQAEKLIEDKKWLSKYIVREEKGITLVDLKEADPALIGSAVKKLAAFVPEEKEEKPEQKEPTDKKVDFDQEEF